MTDVYVLLRSHNTKTRWENTIKAAIDKAIEVEAFYMVIDTCDEWLEQDGKSVNDAGSVRAVLRELMVAKREGIGVAILAHTPKGDIDTLEDLIAGSGQWAAGVDWTVGLWRDKNADQGSNQREIEAIGRMGMDQNISRSVIELDTETGEYTWLGEKETVTSSQHLRELAEMVEPDQEYRLGELGELVGVSPDVVRMAIKRDKNEVFIKARHGYYKLNLER